LTGFAAALVFAVSAATCSQTDSGVTANVKAKFAQDDLVKAHEINVTTRDGVVTLTGEVDSVAARQRAVRLATETEGVSSVVDELHLQAEATTGDRDVDVDVDREVKDGVRETGEAIRKGAEETADAARKVGKATRDAVTDDDRDSDRDGK
jgi:osmotically-inducible protein OsmY